MIVVDVDERFAVIFNKNFQGTLPIPVHAVERGNHKAIINEGFHCYLNKLPKINSAEKGSLHQWLQGIGSTMSLWKIPCSIW